MGVPREADNLSLPSVVKTTEPLFLGAPVMVELIRGRFARWSVDTQNELRAQERALGFEASSGDGQKCPARRIE